MGAKKKKNLKQKNNQQLINKLVLELWEQKSQTKLSSNYWVFKGKIYIYLDIYQRVRE